MIYIDGDHISRYIFYHERSKLSRYLMTFYELKTLCFKFFKLASFYINYIFWIIVSVCFRWGKSNRLFLSYFHPYNCLVKTWDHLPRTDSERECFISWITTIEDSPISEFSCIVYLYIVSYFSNNLIYL